MNNIEKLKKAAMKATQGEWVAFSNIKCGTFAVHTPHDKRCNDIVDWMGFDGAAGSKTQRSHNAKFIAAANPSVVLALIAQLEAAQKERGELRDKFNEMSVQKQFWVKCAKELESQLEKAEAELSAANEKHGWIKCRDQMPDPNQQRRVCVFTPNDAADLRYRLVPASLFKAACSSATHWYYVNDPVEGE